MLTPEIKTNLILKEIGIKRYSLRKKTTDSLNKVLYYYQKGSILALLDKPFENFVENQQGLINAIIASTKCDEGHQESNALSFNSLNELNKKILKTAAIYAKQQKDENFRPYTGLKNPRN